MPEFIEEISASPEQLSEEPIEDRSLVDEIREEERLVETEKPLVFGQYKTEAEAKAEFDNLKRAQEDATRRLEEYNKSERIREARAQDLQERDEQEKLNIARRQRSKEVRTLAAQFLEDKKVDAAAELMEAYGDQRAAYIAKSLVDEALKPVNDQLARYRLKEAEEQFRDHPELQDIKEFAPEAANLLIANNWHPAQVVAHFRSIKQRLGLNTQAPPPNDNVVQIPNAKEQARRDARSLSPGGGTAGPRRSALDQEKLLENAQRRRFLEETLGPLPSRAKK